MSVTSIRIPDDLKERLKAQAEAERRTLANYLVLLLERGADQADQAQKEGKQQ